MELEAKHNTQAFSFEFPVLSVPNHMCSLCFFAAVVV
jgi:hypothetical protein